MRNFGSTKSLILAACAFTGIGVSTHSANAATVDYGADNPVSLTAAGYTQNFNSLPAKTSTAANQTGGWYSVTEMDGNPGPRLAGWDIYTGANESTNGGATGHDRLYAGSTVGNTGAFLDVGTSSTAGSSRALGGLSSGTVGALYFGVTFVNDSGSPITSLSVSYLAELWRTGGTFVSGVDPNYLQFQYMVNPSGGTSIGTQYYGANTVTSLTVNGPSTNNTGTAATYNGTTGPSPYPMTMTGAIDLSTSPLQPGDTIAIKWVMPSEGSSNADAIAIDNLVVTPTLAPEPTSLSLIALSAAGLLTRRRSSR